MASDLRQLLSAVKHCHGTGLVHNDLKFDNIMCHSCVSVSHFLKVLFDMENQKEKEYGMGSKFQSAYTVSILLRTNSPWLGFRFHMVGKCCFYTNLDWGSGRGCHLVFSQSWSWLTLAMPSLQPTKHLLLLSSNCCDGMKIVVWLATSRLWIRIEGSWTLIFPRSGIASVGA